MELVSANTFDPTPRSISSPVPILFIPFNNSKHCYFCGNIYEPLNEGNCYCSSCLYLYIKNTIELDSTDSPANCFGCRKSYWPGVSDYCHDCGTGYSYFSELISLFYKNFSSKISWSDYKRKYCKLLCGKYIYRFGKICSNCHRISSGWTESITKKTIPILYLPWWDPDDKCRVCDGFLKFMSHCQKWCEVCLIIYVGCRHCLTTNIIFGITGKSQCRKCGRESLLLLLITITMI
jgi:hypothetical protein